MRDSYWLCCGSTDMHRHAEPCLERAMGYPQHCRWGTEQEHSAWQKAAQPTGPTHIVRLTNGWKLWARPEVDAVEGRITMHLGHGIVLEVGNLDIDVMERIEPAGAGDA